MSELGNTGDKGPSHSRTVQKTPSLNHVSDQKWELHLKKKRWIPSKAAEQHENPWKDDLFVDDFFRTGGNEMEHRVLTRLRKTFPSLVQKIGMMSPLQDKEFAGHKIPKRSCTLKSIKNKATEELDKIPEQRNTKEDLQCTPTMHTMHRSLSGQINWVQSRTQLQCCYKFSGCASKAASPTFGDVEALNKLARQLKSQPVKFQSWPVTGPLRILEFPDASYRNNDDGCLQRGIAVFLAE